MSSWRRTVPAVMLFFIASMPVVYFQAGNLVYTQAAATNLECSGHSERNSPGEFSVTLWNEALDDAMFEKNETLASNLSHLWFESWDNATIDVPDEDITLAAWVMEADASRPWVILVHGIRSCKANHEVLIPAAMLHQAEFNVVIFDMRDHGNSTVEDGLVSAGQREYRDVLAVWSWLQDEKGADASNIGLYGVSLGAGTAAIAFDQEPLVQALFLESSFASMDDILREELAFAGFPAFLKDAAVFAGKVSSGDNLVEHEPLTAAKNIGNRSMFITQSEEDLRIKIHHSYSLCEVATANVQDGGLVECWFAPSSVAHEDEGVPGILSHATLMLTQPDAYRDHLVGFFEQSLT